MTVNHLHLRTINGGKVHLATGRGNDELFPACISARQADRWEYVVVADEVTCKECSYVLDRMRKEKLQVGQS